MNGSCCPLARLSRQVEKVRQIKMHGRFRTAGGRDDFGDAAGRRPAAGDPAPDRALAHAEQPRGSGLTAEAPDDVLERDRVTAHGGNYMPQNAGGSQPRFAFPSVAMAPRGKKPRTNDETRPAWSRRIAQARLRAGMSQARLGAAIGASQSAVGDYETGAREPNFATLARIGAALGVEPAWLIFGFGKGMRDAGSECSALDADERRDQEFAELFVATDALLRSEGMPCDLTTVTLLARQLERQLDLLPADVAQASRVPTVIDAHRRVLKALRAHLRGARLP